MKPETALQAELEKLDHLEGLILAQLSPTPADLAFDGNDWRPSLANVCLCVDRLLKISERRAALHGLGGKTINVKGGLVITRGQAEK